ncbi:hypothetical protein ACFRAO_23955, partial [Streptomyces sp. NPDC056656]
MAGKGKGKSSEDRVLEVIAKDVAQTLRAAAQSRLAEMMADSGHDQSHSSEASGQTTHISTPKPLAKESPVGTRSVEGGAPHDQTHSESRPAEAAAMNTRSVEDQDVQALHDQTHSEGGKGGGGSGGKLRSVGTRSVEGGAPHDQTHSESRPAEAAAM